MRVYFRTECKAEVTEYWGIDAPDGWSEMSKAEKLGWLGENLDSAEFNSDQVHDEEDRTVIDFYGP